MTDPTALYTEKALLFVFNNFKMSKYASSEIEQKLVRSSCKLRTKQPIHVLEESNVRIQKEPFVLVVGWRVWLGL